MDYQVHTLKNGLRLVHQESNAKVAHCAILINTGTRDELPEEHGIAHFIEHLIFKGTTHRKAFHILSRMEDVGGEIDAYTTKEETCIYASFLSQYYERTLELFSDIVFNSTFPVKEIAREREVISDEINSYKDSPAEQIFDDFEELVFDGHPLGRNILGTPKNLKRFKAADFLAFIKRTYNTDQILICSVGNISFDKLAKQFERHFGSVPENLRTWKRPPFRKLIASDKGVKHKTHQAHCIIGTTAYHFKDKKRLPLLLLNNILGGPGMNSRLNLLLREKHGMVYNVEAGYNPYQDTGVLTIYFGTDRENLEKAIRLVHGELKTLREKPLGKEQLRKAKMQMIGQIAISMENPENLLMSLGKSYMLYGKVDSLEKVTKRIEGITAEEIQEVAAEVFNVAKLSTLIYQ